jgi:predicted acylesterase/phospholipase RssA
VDANTGEYVVFDNKNTKFEDMPLAAKASASIPGIFPHTLFEGHVLMDGGTVWNLNMGSAIKYCQELGFADNQIIVDAVTTYGEAGLSISK